MRSVKDQFLKIVRDEHLYLIYKAINHAYQIVHLEYEGWDLDPDMKRISYGYLRNSFIGNNLLGASCPNDMEVRKHHHPANGYPTIEVAINKQVLLTLKSSDDPETLPDQSQTRKDNAAVNQLTLFEECPTSVQSQSKPVNINGIVTYKNGEDGRPEFISIVFPSENYSDVIDDNIDVVALCLDYEEKRRAEADKNLLQTRPQPIEEEKKPVRFKKQA